MTKTTHMILCVILYHVVSCSKGVLTNSEVRTSKRTLPCFISLLSNTSRRHPRFTTRIEGKPSSCLLPCSLSEAGQARETNPRSKKEKSCFRNCRAVTPPDHYTEYMRLQGWLDVNLDDPDLAHLFPGTSQSSELAKPPIPPSISSPAHIVLLKTHNFFSINFQS
ncbi:hypothetical protein Peur_035570 [Populus x canadensis]